MTSTSPDAPEYRGMVMEPTWGTCAAALSATVPKLATSVPLTKTWVL